MNASLLPLYSNEVSPAFLHELDAPPFSDIEFAAFDAYAQEVVDQQNALTGAHPAAGIYRIATEGSSTLNGGTIQRSTSVLTFTLADGREVRAAQKGDHAVYADGTTAKIVTGAGQRNSDIALVGSYLSNGDQIISTLQNIAFFVAREGIASEQDFLAERPK